MYFRLHVTIRHMPPARLADAPGRRSVPGALGPGMHLFAFRSGSPREAPGGQGLAGALRTRQDQAEPDTAILQTVSSPR